MQQLTNIDELLEQWEHVKTISCPRGDSMQDAIIHECEKNRIDAMAQNLRQRRFENKVSNEAEYADEFANAYYAFTQEFVYRILKNSK